MRPPLIAWNLRECFFLDMERFWRPRVHILVPGVPFWHPGVHFRSQGHTRQHFLNHESGIPGGLIGNQVFHFVSAFRVLPGDPLGIQKIITSKN